MKTILSKMIAVMLLVGGAVVGTVQAENGSEHVMNFHLRHNASTNERADPDSGRRFVQMLEEQPTAAGPEAEAPAKDRQDAGPTYLSPIHRDRALYGSGK
ncbi:hypothetical protein D9M68_606440 [compost metagenome]